MRPAVFHAVARAFAALAATLIGGAMTHAAAGFPEASALPSRPDLPDPLVMLDGTRVATPHAWSNRRRPELKALFQHYMYGSLPLVPGLPSRSVSTEDRGSLGGKATRKDVTIHFPSDEGPPIHLLVFIPNKRARPAPVFLGTNFHGNHTILADPTIPLPTAWMPPGGPGVVDHKATDAGRGKDAAVWSIEAAVDRGYAVATFYCGDVAPDRPGPAVAPKGGQLAWRADESPAVAAWAWGLIRAVDCLQGDPDLDPGRIAVVGHSRLGKAAILAGAFDERIALTVAHQAGCGGTAPGRGKVGEQVKQINDRFPRWFAAEFKQFNDHPDRLPFDQNGLIALAAPRPVLLTNATGDAWANPAGQFDVLKAADPAYRLLGVRGIDDQPMPETGKLVGDRLGYHIRPGKHAMEPRDWTVWFDFADRHMGPKD